MKKFISILLLFILQTTAYAGPWNNAGFGTGDVRVDKNSVDFDERSENPSTPSSNRLKLFTKDNGGTTSLYQIDSAGTVSLLGTGSGGDLTKVGDCSTGDCFDGTTGTTLTFNAASGDQTLSYVDADTEFLLTEDLKITDANQAALLLFTTGSTDWGIYGGNTFELKNENTSEIFLHYQNTAYFQLGDTTLDYVLIQGGPTTSNEMRIGTAGVSLITDNDGAITFLGLGNGADEDLTWNLDDNANAVSISSSTGLEEFNFLGSGTFPFMGVSGARSSLYSEATDAAGYAAVDYYTNGDDWQGGVGGSATDVPGVFYFYNLTDDSANALTVDSVASGTNWLEIKNAVDSSAPSIESKGLNDANVNISLITKGSGDVTTDGGFTSSNTGSLGWSVVAAANQACTTTCTSAAVVGFNTAGPNMVGTSDATADECLCAGAS